MADPIEPAEAINFAQAGVDDRTRGPLSRERPELSVLALLAVVFAFVALSRTGARGELARRVRRLEEEVATLRAALVQSGTEAPPPAAAAEAVPADRASVPASPPDRPIAPGPADSGPADRRAVEPPAAGAAPTPEPAVPVGAKPETPTPALVPPPGTAPPGAEPRRGAGTLGGVDWERWLGVRGAAVLGGVALALAGLLFFRYSIEHGLVPPWLRVVLGIATGLGALGVSELGLRRRYAGTANALAGGGLVVLYAALWAASALYELLPPGATFLAMAAVTVAGCALSWRHDALVIATIGLIGGFLTPLFASTGEDRPIGLFGYVLLLDAGLLYMARRRHWPVLALLALVATALYEVLWVGVRMGAERTLLGTAIVALFALLFALAAPRDGGAGPLWRISQRAALALPFAIGVYFAARADLAMGALQLCALLATIGVAAGWVARRQGEARLALGVAAATVAVAVVWAVQHRALGGAPWTTAAALVLLVLAHHAAVELARASDDQALRRALADAAALVGLGVLGILIASSTARSLALWPLLAGGLGAAVPLVRQGTLAGRGRVQVASATAVALVLAVYRLAHGEAADPFSTATPGAVVLAAMLAVAVGWQALAIAQAGGVAARPAESAAAALAVVLVLALVPDPPRPAMLGLGVALGLGLMIALSASRRGGGRWMLAAALATALAQLAWTMEIHPAPSALGLAIAVGTAIVFATWPLAMGPRVHDDPWTWRAAALAPIAGLPGLVVLFEDLFGDGVIAVLPLGLGAVVIAVAARARDLWPAGHPAATRALAWLCGAALALVTIAIPLQLEKEWLTIGWALEGAALTLLWKRLDHPGLKYTAVVLLLAAAVRLAGNPEVLAYHARGAWRLANWLAYAYLLPAAAMVVAARELHALEVPRLRDWERPLYVRARPLGSALVGLAALVVVFAWINLAIADWFSIGDTLRLAAARTQAEKLTTSIAWALYAIAILALGVRLASGALRWASLVLLTGTIAKIFLYDLGELRDLYRVGALLGLALSLIVVSLVYQRFVFRAASEETGGT